MGTPLKSKGFGWGESIYKHKHFLNWGLCPQAHLSGGGFDPNGPLLGGGFAPTPPYFPNITFLN